MCRVLVVDDELFGGETVKLVIETNSKNTVDVVTTTSQAVDLVTRSIVDGKCYEAFLIDQQLGDGENGIELMKTLNRISPDTEAIIITGYGDSANGLNAYRAGAFRYLTKPFDNQELLYLIDSLREWHKTRQEHGWQKIFSEMMEAALQRFNFKDTAEVVVNYSLKLGFERAHLFWVPTGKEINKENLFIGIACAGHNRIQNFKGRLYPLLEWFDPHDITRNFNAIFIRDFSEESANTANSDGYQLPLLEATLLPIGRADTLAGFLLLDYGEHKRTVSEHERSLLNLFARQVSVVLNQASLHGREQRLLQESATIQNIGRQITTKAASANLIDLLEEIRRQIGKLMDVSNCSVFLKNEENNELDLHLLYENGRRRKGLIRPIGDGFEKYLLNSERAVVLSYMDLDIFIEDHQTDSGDAIPSTVLGVPLRVENKTIGGIVVSQSSIQGSEDFERNRRILLSVADQVAGAIQISRLSEAEKEDARRMQVLQKASTEMLRIAQENEDHFWLMLLTIATSNFGLGFNRALLFLEEENFRRLCGRMGVGTESTKEASRDWERDEKRRYDFQDFLTDLGTRRRRHTSFEKLVRQVQFDLAEEEDAIGQVVREKQRTTLQPAEIAARLPVEITRTFSLATCAILPLRAGDKVLGMVIVDNKHNRRPLNERSLDRLQSLLDNAGLVWETRREQKKSESLLSANYRILSGARDQSLRETLNQICRTARFFSGADWAIILPILEDGHRRFDVNNIGFDGELQNNPIDGIVDSTHLGGISQHVLRRSKLVVNDIDAESRVNQQLNISQHHFIQSEGVKALIGAAVRSRDDEKPLGLLYLDYRQPHIFSKLETQQALSFASLAGVAISNARRMDELHQRRQLKTAKEIAETIGLGLDLEKTMEATIQILHTVFKKTRPCVLLYQNDIKALKFAPATLKYYKIENTKYRRQDTFPLNGRSIACRVARKALRTKKVEHENIGDVTNDADYLPLGQNTQSELCVSLMNTRNELLGIFALERDKLNGFDNADEDLVKTVAQQLSVAIERAQQSEELAFRTIVAAQTAWAADIAHEINNEVGQIRNWTYMLRDRLEDGSELQEFAKRIEESAAVLSSTGPWSDQPPQIVKLDLFLERNLKKLTSQRSLTVEFQLEAPDVYIRVNPTEFQHVLRHLVRNAARAMSNSKTKKLMVTTRCIESGRVEVLFQDSGPGISKEVQLSVFQRPITTKGRGGYGLLLVRQMIEDMHGQIRLVPQKRGRGAVFSIQFPIASVMDGTVE
ncbi:MAG: GAF domain-containing protein [Anaerolineales bacterium]|nr:GAF domain-containing protein [Anaerolineales bacterium]